MIMNEEMTAEKYEEEAKADHYTYTPGELY